MKSRFKDNLKFLKYSSVLGLFLFPGFLVSNPSFSIASTEKPSNPSEMKDSGDKVRSEFNLLQKKASEGDVTAQYLVGRHYDEEKNYTEAAKWYEKAIRKNHSDAEVSLGYLYQEGRGVDKNLAKAVELYRKAVAQQNNFGQMLLAYAYQDGLGVDQNYSKAAELFKKSADKGNIFSQVGIGYLYMRGWGVPLDNQEALKYFHKAEALGNPSGLYFLGIMYRDGLGVERNYQTALAYFQEASNKGNTDSIVALGQMYQEGKAVRQSTSKAIKYFRQAADQKNVKAFFALGDLYETGRVRDLKIEDALSQAKEWYGKACDNGNEAGCDKYAYLNKETYLQARFQYYLKVASEKNPVAELTVGHMYELGQSIKQNHILAKEWYGKACDHGNEDGCKNYARLNMPKEHFCQDSK